MSFDSILILAAIVIGFLFLYFKKDNSTESNEEIIDENNDLDAKSKLFLNNAIGELLKDEESSIFQILNQQKKAYDDFNTKKGAIDTSIESRLVPHIIPI